MDRDNNQKRLVKAKHYLFDEGLFAYRYLRLTEWICYKSLKTTQLKSNSQLN
jgi:hypothetical protein